LVDKMSRCPRCGRFTVVIVAGYHYNQGFCGKCQIYHYVDGLLSVMPLNHVIEG